MKKKALLTLLMVFVLTLVGCGAKEPDVKEEPVTTEAPTVTEEPVAETEDGTKGIGFVMIGLGNEFFEGLKKEFGERFIANGWEVDIANGEFNPQSQITAMENFIAMEKDVIVLWAVSPEPLNTVAQQAMDAGIKVIAFVQPLENYDASLQADNVRFATAEAKLAADWIEKNFPDAEDQSVPVAIITRDNVDSTKEQGDILRGIEQYSSKIKLVSAFDNDEESIEAGVHSAETIYTMNPEAKVFLTVNSAVALGVNNYFTAMSSPVTDYSDMAIFTLNGGGEILEQIVKSQTDESPLRGTIMTGGVELTVDDVVKVVDGVMDGSFGDKYDMFADNLYVFEDTIFEFFDTGNVTSVTDADFE